MDPVCASRKGHSCTSRMYIHHGNSKYIAIRLRKCMVKILSHDGREVRWLYNYRMAQIFSHFSESTNGHLLQKSGMGIQTILEHLVFLSITSGTTGTLVIVSSLVCFTFVVHLPWTFSQITGLTSILTHSLRESLFPQSPRILSQTGLSLPAPFVVSSFRYRLGHRHVFLNLNQHRPRRPLKRHLCFHVFLSQFRHHCSRLQFPRPHLLTSL
jgi:hypothetical protein